LKAASGGLIALLNSSGQQYVMADLYTITLAGGTVARYTSADVDIPWNSSTFSSKGPVLSRSKIRCVIGVEVDTLDLEVTAQSQHLLGGAPWLSVCRSGGLDGARVKLERAFMSAWGQAPAGTIWLFEGRVADLEVGRTTAKIQIKSDLDLLNVQMPRNLYQPGCLHTLYDAGCTAIKASFGTATTATSGSTAGLVKCGLGQVDDYFTLGTITFTSGVNVGVSRSVKKYTTGALQLMRPLLNPPGIGDTFTAYAGCDKSTTTCQNRFSNLPNFRGFPFVPAPETAR
jgi:uncharacterized phage protein (TIGR02218 family)